LQTSSGWGLQIDRYMHRTEMVERVSYESRPNEAYQHGMDCMLENKMELCKKVQDQND
jgi:hypothetical protein